MAEVPLLRIDERLIHGQVVAGFLRSLSCNRVIIIDDGVRNDKFMKKILEMAMPPSAKLTVYSCAEATESWRKDQFGPGRAIIIFKSISGAHQAHQAGFDFKTLQIGGCIYSPSKKQVFGPVYMNDEDAVFLNDLENAGVDIIFQVLAEKKATSWEKIKAIPQFSVAAPNIKGALQEYLLEGPLAEKAISYKRSEMF